MAQTRGSRGGIRLAELIASLSLATDLGLGVPEEHVLRQTVIATRLARAAGMSEDEQAAIFYVSLFVWVGCVADSHEMAQWFGDDRQLRVDSYQVDKAGLPMLRFMLERLAPGATPIRRISVIGQFFVGGAREVMAGLVGHCETTGNIAERLGLDPEIRPALMQVFERWDGKGQPDGRKGKAIARSIRVVSIADEAEMFCRTGGIAAAVEVVKERRGTEFDPSLVDAFVAHADAILGDLESIDAWSTVIDGCQPLDRRLLLADADDVLETFGDYGDLKTTWFTGHSKAMATLAEGAARQSGATAAAAAKLRRAALVSRLGVVGVSTGIWDKPGPLSASETERVRTVPYLTERVLSRQKLLQEVSELAAMRCERMDGSGYPRGLTGKAISPHGRILAAADVYQALSEDRPHRAALSLRNREAALHDEVTAGRLDGAAVSCVLAAAGHRTGAKPLAVRGLTEREIEVLALLARGLSNKEMAERLSISAKTVGTHVEHIYSKIGASTRGSAAMFAMQHGFVTPALEEDGT
jgi:HD-GYP domain-containing protein (c-di-GMP phosphodiesterase class II)